MNKKKCFVPSFYNFHFQCVFHYRINALHYNEERNKKKKRTPMLANTLVTSKTKATTTTTITSMW